MIRNTILQILCKEIELVILYILLQLKNVHSEKKPFEQVNTRNF